MVAENNSLHVTHITRNLTERRLCISPFLDIHAGAFAGVEQLGVLCELQFVCIVVLASGEASSLAGW